MACDFPIPAYRSPEVSEASGKRLITFNPKNAVDPQTGVFYVPCGRCMGCRLKRAQEWSTRIMHEASQHEFNSFITLTYDDEHLPRDYGLQLDHQQDFIKRLRAKVAYDHEGLRLRFYMCGEYGPKFGRPHYHAAIFGYDFPDKVEYAVDESGNVTYLSKSLDKLWGHGKTTTGNLDPASAAYIAQYVTKKITGDKADDHYYRFSPVSGEFHHVRPEYATQSRGIGATWLSKFKADVFPSGFIVVDGVPRPVPRYYTKKLSEAEQAKLKADSRVKARKFKGENTNWRRHQRATVRDARITSLKRDKTEK